MIQNEMIKTARKMVSFLYIIEQKMNQGMKHKKRRRKWEYFFEEIQNGITMKEAVQVKINAKRRFFTCIAFWY